MIRKVYKAPPHIPGNNYLLMLAHKTLNPEPSPDQKKPCRFAMFVRLRPGIISYFKDQQRVWTYRGDKFYDEEYKMLRSLLNHLKKDLIRYDRVELYDNHKPFDDRIILKITDDELERNGMKQYSLMLLNYELPEWLVL